MLVVECILDNDMKKSVTIAVVVFFALLIAIAVIYVAQNDRQPSVNDWSPVEIDHEKMARIMNERVKKAGVPWLFELSEDDRSSIIFDIDGDANGDLSGVLANRQYALYFEYIGSSDNGAQKLASEIREKLGYFARARYSIVYVCVPAQTLESTTIEDARGAIDVYADRHDMGDDGLGFMRLEPNGSFAKIDNASSLHWAKQIGKPHSEGLEVLTRLSDLETLDSEKLDAVMRFTVPKTSAQLVVEAMRKEYTPETIMLKRTGKSSSMGGSFVTIDVMWRDVMFTESGYVRFIKKAEAIAQKHNATFVGWYGRQNID